MITPTVRVLVLSDSGGLWKKAIPRRIDVFAETVGGYVERIALDRDVGIYVNPEALSQRRFLNWNATTIVRDHIPGYTGAIAGTAIVAGIDSRGDPIDVPSRFTTSSVKLAKTESDRPPYYRGRHAGA